MDIDKFPPSIYEYKYGLNMSSDSILNNFMMEKIILYTQRNIKLTLFFILTLIVMLFRYSNLHLDMSNMTSTNDVHTMFINGANEYS